MIFYTIDDKVPGNTLSALLTPGPNTESYCVIMATGASCLGSYIVLGDGFFRWFLLLRLAKFGAAIQIFVAGWVRVTIVPRFIGGGGWATGRLKWGLCGDSSPTYWLLAHLCDGFVGTYNRIRTCISESSTAGLEDRSDKNRLTAVNQRCLSFSYSRFDSAVMLV